MNNTNICCQEDVYAQWKRAHRFDWVFTLFWVVACEAVLIAILFRGSELLMP